MSVGTRRSTHRRSIAALAVAMALAACGGGGGEGGNPYIVGTPFSGRLTELKQPFTVAPGYAHMQFDGVQSPTKSSISGPDPSTGLLLAIDPPAGTVALNGGFTKFSIDFDDDSTAFATATDGSDLFTRQSATMLIPGAASGYEYASYGAWSRTITSCLFSTCGSSFMSDAFYFGSPSLSSEVPKQGQATFNGTMRGYHSNGTQSAAALKGDATLVADFDARSVTGSFHDIQVSTLLGPSIGYFGDINVNATISGAGINGTVSGGAGGSGTLEAGFFGPTAQEMAGAFLMTGGGQTTGAFAAKQ